MIQRHPLAGIPAPLWRLVALARHRLLMLDYDGTLAPFRVERSLAEPLPRAIELLERIAGSPHTSAAIVSGRPLSEVERLVGAIPVIFVGEHGWERRMPDGSLVRRPLDEAVEAALERAERLAFDRGWGDRIERKRSGIVLHTRGLSPEDAARMERECIDAWEALVVAAAARVDRIDGGVEMRARGRNKGTVVLSLLSQAPPGSLGVFIGDDVTDEDAFEQVRDWGFGIRVGTDERPTLAMGRLPTPESVACFLEEWIRLTEGSATSSNELPA